MCNLQLFGVMATKDWYTLIQQSLHGFEISNGRFDQCSSQDIANLMHKRVQLNTTRGSFAVC